MSGECVCVCVLERHQELISKDLYASMSDYL